MEDKLNIASTKYQTSCRLLRNYSRKHRVSKPVVAPIPRAFDFGFTARRPLVPLPAVTMFLNRETRDVLTLIEGGQLRWAFDIRTAKSARREVRVLRQSLFEFTGLYAPTELPPDAEKTEFSKVIDLILPPGITVATADIPLHGTGQNPRNSLSLLLKIRLRTISDPRLLFPREPILRGTEIAQCFSCNRQHLVNLIHEKSLSALDLKHGPKASPCVTRASVIEFLKQRRMS